MNSCTKSPEKSCVIGGHHSTQPTTREKGGGGVEHNTGGREHRSEMQANGRQHDDNPEGESAGGSCDKASKGAGGDGRRPRGRKESSATNGLSDVETTLLRSNPWLAQIPLLTPKMCENGSLPAVTAHIAKHWPSDFCWSSCFEPSFLAALMYEGYLPTAHGPVEGPIEYILLPKLHQERCIVFFEDLRVSRSVRSNSREYELSVDTAFDEVVEKCLAQHGESWLHPPIVDGFKRLFRAGGTGQVKMHSIEVKLEGVLVAGELGYSVGRTYCSLSGFTIVSGSGSVQCLGLALLLHERGFDFWDLGMGMEYKVKMGAREISRHDFLQRLRASRDLPCKDLSLPGVKANCLLVPCFRKGSYVRVCSSHAVHAGRVGVVHEYTGSHFRVNLEDGIGTKESFVFSGQQLEDICLAEDIAHREQTLEDGIIVVQGLAGLPLLFRRDSGWTRSRRRQRQSGAGRKLNAAASKAPAASDAEMQVESSASHGACDNGLDERLRGGGDGGHNPHLPEAGQGVDCTGKHKIQQMVAANGRAQNKHADVGDESERWAVKKGHHVGWNAAALRRRQMRLVLLQGSSSIILSPP